MTSLKQGRARLGLTQVQAAAQLGVSQPYLSQLERGRRPLTPELERRAARVYKLSAALLPRQAEVPMKSGSDERLVRDLAALGYPGYAHVRPSRLVDPASFLLDALSQDDLEGRVTSAVPWVLLHYPDLDWSWLVSQAKLGDVQNRLGLLVTLARQVSDDSPDMSGARSRLAAVEGALERSRLVAQTTLCREAMPAVERQWLTKHRSPEARHWRVLTSLTRGHLRHVE